MKGIKRIIFGIVSIILGIILVINLYNFININLLKNDISSIAGYSVLEVVSGSMEPTIHVGDMIIINTNDKECEAGDIITFRDVNGSFVTHRIVAINDKEMITQGDFNDSQDEPISVDNIVGKYVTRIPNGGKVISAFKSPFTMIMILVIGVLICIFISTDKEGNPILESDELEFQEYLKQKDKKEEVKAPKKKTSSSNVKKATTKKSNTKKATTKKSTSKKGTNRNNKKK